MSEIPLTVKHYRSGELPWQRDASGATFWAAELTKVSLTYFRVGPHTRFEAHSHGSEQITLVLSGTLFFEISSEIHRVAAGEAIAVPGNVEHAVYSKEQPVEAVDAWSPPPLHLGEA